ncbi:DUF551 domain-containing protein [Cronobacter dublinensis]
MSTISKERLEEKRAAALLLTEYKHEDVRLAAQENVQVIDELLALRKERQAAVPVEIRAALPDRERLESIANKSNFYGIGLSEVEALARFAIAAIDTPPAPPAPVVPDDMPKGLAGQIVSLLAHNIGDKLLAQKIWNACRAAMLAAAPGKEPLSVEALAGALRNAPLAPSDNQGRQREPVAVPGHDYKAIVERIAEILHGKVTDLDLLTVTVQAMKERVKEKHQMLMEDTVSRQELTRSLCDLLGVEPTYSLEALKEAIEKRGAEPWIQCSERMPEKYDRNIWLWDGDSAHCGYVWTGSSFADWNEEYIELKGVTHWMPMIVPLAPGKQVAETDTTSAEVESLAKDGE